MKDLNTHQRYLIEEFAEQYHERDLSRRDLLIRTLLITGSIPTTAAILTTLGCGGDDDSSATPTKAATVQAAQAPKSPSPAATTAPASPSAAATSPSAAASAAAVALDARDVTFKGDAGDIFAYLARPASTTGTLQAVLIIPDNRGLVEHFKDISRRFAREGFVAMAIDLVSRNGGTAKADANHVAGLLGGAKPEDLDADLQSGLNYLKSQPGVRTAGLAVTGFCFGGNYAWEIAVLSKDVAAVCPFYGVPRLIDRLGETRAAVLAFYGATDTRVTGTADAAKQKLIAAGKTADNRIYDGAGHAFFQDDRPSYNEAAAKDAWPRMLDWFRKYLPQA